MLLKEALEQTPQAHHNPNRKVKFIALSQRS